MPAHQPAIENLMKVSLSIRTATSDPTAEQDALFEFIYGIGPDGITPFEKALYGKKAGDRIDIGDISGNLLEALGHLKPALCEQTGIVSPDALQVMVTRVVKAPDRDVVKAIAAGGGCSDCGCGCGGH